MSAFDEAAFNVSRKSELTLNDRLTMIDAAYAGQDRATCERLIDDLYAFFDAHEAG